MERTDTRPPFVASGGVIPPELRKIKTPCYVLDEAALIKNAESMGDIAKRTAEKNEEKFVQMLNAVEWSDTALRRMLPVVEEEGLQIAKAYILEKIRTKETFEV